MTPTWARAQAAVPGSEGRSRCRRTPAVVADIATPEAREQNQLADVRGMSPQQIQAHAVEVCRRVAALIDQKTPGAEAEGFKRPGMDAPRRPAL